MAKAAIPIVFGTPVADFTEQGGAKVIDVSTPAETEFPHEQVPEQTPTGEPGGVPAPQTPAPVTKTVEPAAPAAPAAEPSWHGFSQSELIAAGWTDEAGYTGQPGNYLTADKFAAKLASQNDVVKNALSASAAKEAELQATIDNLRADVGNIQQAQVSNAQAAYDQQWNAAVDELTTASADFDEEGVLAAKEKMKVLKASPPAQAPVQAHWSGDQQSFNSSVQSEMSRMGKDKDPVWRSQASQLANFMTPADYATPAEYVKAVDEAITRAATGATARQAVTPTPPGPTPTPSAGGPATAVSGDGKSAYASIASLPALERGVAEEMWLASDQSDRKAFDEQYLASFNFVANQPAEK